MKLREGTQAYNQCLRNQIKELRKTPQPPDLSDFSEPERNFLDLICGSEKNYDGPAAYYRCLENEIDSVKGVPQRHDVSNFTKEEQFSIYTVCGLSIAPRRGSLGEYKQCLMVEIEALQKVTRPDLSGLSQGAQESIESACQYYENYRGPAEYYQCLKRHVEEGTHYSESSSPLVSGSVELPSSQQLQTKSTSNDDVRRAQRLLQQLGYDPGPVDGRLGPRTRNAVIAFQTDQGVDPFGVMNDLLLAQLERRRHLSEDENVATPLPASVRPSEGKNVAAPQPDSEPILPLILGFAVFVFTVFIVIRSVYRTKWKTPQYPEPLEQKSSYQSPGKSDPQKQPAPSEQQKSSQTAYKKKAQSEAEVKKGIKNFPEVKIEHITDGDTLIVVKNWDSIKIRLDSIDCPEVGQPWGDISKYGLIKLIGGRKVRLEEHGIDHHRRTLATLYVQHGDGSEWINVNERMVTLGHAWVMSRFYDHLPKDRQDKLNSLQRWARSKKVGMWKTPNPIPPWKWRNEG